MTKQVIHIGNKRGRGSSLVEATVIQCEECSLLTVHSVADTDAELSRPCNYCARFATPKRGWAKDHILYYTWQGMKRRCYSKQHSFYSDYGGRGITVCDRWLLDFWNFVDDMGERPEGYTLDRINNDEGYSPSNCRWADAVTQANNKRPGKVRAASFTTEWCAKRFGV